MASIGASPKASRARSASAKQTNTRVTYADCLAGRVPAPNFATGQFIFSILMVGGMATLMGTFNGIRVHGLDFFASYHWIYPLAFCVAYFLRVGVVDEAVAYVDRRFIAKRCKGAWAYFAQAVANTIIMTPLMTAVSTLLLNGWDNYLITVLSALPLTMPAAFVFGYFIVTPISKLIYGNFVVTANGAKLIQWAEKYAMPWMYLANS